MNVQQIIETKIQETFLPEFWSVENESHMHNVAPGSETHFKLVLVSDEFIGLRKVQRHQKVYALLKEEMEGPVHALALHTYTMQEWQESGNAPDSPNCLGGSQRDKAK